MAAQAQRKLSAVRGAAAAKPTKRAPTSKNKGGRPATRLSTVADRTEREMLVVLRRKLATMIDACDKPSALSPLITRFERTDQKIRAIDARAAEAAEGDGDEDDEYDESFDPNSL